MQFSDTTNKNGLIQYCEDLCRLGDGGITSDTVLFAKFTAFLNQSEKKVAIALMRADKNWKFDDSKYSDFPIASIDLVASQRDYSLPAATSGGAFQTLYKINRVRILDSSANYHELPIMGADEQESDATAFPTSYRVLGSSLRLNCLPSGITTTSGLEIKFQRASNLFTVASTTEQPGFIDSYHDILCYDASSAYLMPVNSDLAIVYSQVFDKRLKELLSDYALRDDNVVRRLKPRVENCR